MKRIIVICSVMAALLLTGCWKEADTEGEAYQIFYPDRSYTHILPLEYQGISPTGDTPAQVEELLAQLSGSPSKVDYAATISGFTVKGYDIREAQITINLSEEYRQLEATREVLTRAAIVKTLTQLENIVYVTLQVNGENLVDSLGLTVGVMSADTFIDHTGADMKNYGETELTLYFANGDGDRLVKVNRRLMYNTNVAKEKLVVEQLIKGPLSGNGRGIMPTLNPETKILGVNIKDGICYVNLDNHFLVSVYNVNADAVVYSIVNSLTELPGILKVQISVEGEAKIRYREKYDLSTIFEPNPNLIQSPREEGE